MTADRFPVETGHILLFARSIGDTMSPMMV